MRWRTNASDIFITGLNRWPAIFFKKFENNSRTIHDNNLTIKCENTTRSSVLPQSEECCVGSMNDNYDEGKE